MDVGAPWGVLLESELAGADVVRAYALTHAPVDAPTAWVRGRSAPTVLLTSRDEAQAAVDAAWFPGHVFALREVPALRLHTTHGRLLVADLWGDSGFRPLAQPSGAGVLRLHTPMLSVLAAVDRMRSGCPTARIEAIPIGWRATARVSRRARLRAWSSMALPDGWDWCEDENAGIGGGPWAALRAFGHVNSREDILRAERQVDEASARAQASEVDPHLDVREVEAYLRSVAGG